MKNQLLLLTVLFSLSLTAQNITYRGGDGDGGANEEYSGAISLPLTLLRFEAIPQDEFVLLSWSTEHEIDTDFFTIEKTHGGESFETVGTTPAAGKSVAKLDYTYVDQQPYAGLSYYRLKTTDIDGSISLSHLAEVSKSTPEWGFTLSPNPTTSREFRLTLEGDIAQSDGVVVTLQDAQGRELLQRDYHTHGATLTITAPERLTSGSYLVRVVDGRGNSSAKILLVNQ